MIKIKSWTSCTRPSPDAYGVDQKELDTQIAQRRRCELRPALPPAPALSLSPLPDLNLTLHLSLVCEPLVNPPS